MLFFNDVSQPCRPSCCTGAYLPYHHHQQQEAPKLLPPLQPAERPAKRQRTADAFVPFALPPESDEQSAELRNAKPLPIHERVRKLTLTGIPSRRPLHILAC